MLSVEESSDANWSDAGMADDIPRQGALVFKTRHGNVALFRTLDDEYFALLDRCPHRGGPLSQGIVHGCKITCPLHGWHIDLTTGSAVAPDVGQVRTFPVQLRDNRLWVDFS